MTCTFSFVGAGIIDISLSNCSFVSSEALFIIFNDPSLSDSVSISFVLYEPVLSFCGLHYTCFIYLPVVTLPNYLWANYYLLQGELFNTLPNVMILG